ncbi:MAG: hypothetical protein K0M50_22655 [Prolixibacteraceae bacterium]|jgi:hypothetical protein|nr:hypothetical protein [Prolixibacteraceae bacterium]
MSTTDLIRNNIIDKLLTISNEDYLLALYQLVNNSTVGQDTVQLSEEQVTMLQLSDEDIVNGKLIAHYQLDKDDLQWLSEQ